MMKFININIDFLNIYSKYLAAHRLSVKFKNEGEDIEPKVRYTLNKNECILLNIKNLSKI